ncbi:extracellular solute-binding protein [Clostridium aminobutyricum]|uniref:Extracellular solute-binding protein n=1 Tax=Clostridium aminobutyricum TaxID=33953 RepID=A0A939IIX3_CLOAM|nr:extracellular solute-binding protein [Clostridium aminobutyricum]
MNRRITLLTISIMILIFLVLLSGCDKQGKSELLDAENPVTITVWHYYNGEQQKAFDEMVSEFNETDGLEKGIVVGSHAYGGVDDLQDAVLNAVHKNVGAADVPNIFSAYADTAYAIDKLGYVVDISKYMTQDELSNYIDGYMEEGKFGKDGEIKIFPVAKATEVFALNKTDWDKFSAATGETDRALGTIEGITEVAEKYYKWTDSLTPNTKNDGKAFFGRDALANYFIIGYRQLGQELFTSKDGKTILNLDERIAKKLWDNYYIPYIKGYFTSNGRYRSDDVKTGEIIAYVGSTASVTYFPREVIVNDEVSYPIEVAFYPSPKFAGGEDYAVQQGAGMVITNGKEKETYASIEFLKWFTQKERNLHFAINAGYLPVTYEANDEAFAEQAIKGSGESEKLRKLTEVGMKTVNSNKLYTIKVFEKANDARKILEYSMSDKAKADRAKVLEKINNGISLDTAVKEYSDDRNFENWYFELKSELEECVDNE